MKPRHAAALALVGWYLMTPPLGPTKCSSVPNEGLAMILSCQARIESQAPLREWKREPDSQEFESKTDCERAISNDCHRKVEADGTSNLEGELCNDECIATDDPRLKGK
jgi:hypothetical protein